MNYRGNLIENNLWITFFSIITISLIIIGTIYSYIIPTALILVVLFSLIYFKCRENSYRFFIFLIPFLPEYFSISISDSLPLITVSRIIYLMFLIDELIIKNKLSLFFITIKKDRFSKYILIYYIGVTIPILYNFTFSGAFYLISLLMETIFFYYIIKMNIKSKKNLDNVIDILMIASLILGVLGILEYLSSFNIFSILNITNRADVLVDVEYIRMGSRRIVSAFGHPLGYGLYLTIMIPLVFYQINRFKNNKIKKLRYTFLLMLLCVNILLTGSRSTLLVLVIELLVIFTYLKTINKIIIGSMILIVSLAIVVMSFSSISEEVPILKLVSDNVKMMSDTFFGTNYIDNFGNNEDPFLYRNTLIKAAMERDTSTKILGAGYGSVEKNPVVIYSSKLNPWNPYIKLKSIDNYYIKKFFEIGFIGVGATLILYGGFTLKMIVYSKKNYLNKILIVSSIGYFVHLFMVDDLNTIIYIWIIFSLFSSNMDIMDEKYLKNTAIMKGYKK